MARKRVVSRTIKTNSVTCMVVNTTTGKTENAVYHLGGTFKDNQTILKKLQKMYDDDTMKIVAVLDVTIVSELREMDEEFFIQNSRVVDVNEDEADNA